MRLILWHRDKVELLAKITTLPISLCVKHSGSISRIKRVLYLSFNRDGIKAFDLRGFLDHEAYLLFNEFARDGFFIFFDDLLVFAAPNSGGLLIEVTRGLGRFVDNFLKLNTRIMHFFNDLLVAYSHVLNV